MGRGKTRFLNMKKLEMRVGAIGVDEKSGDPVIVLKNLENTHVLPIWIGLPEARAITLAVNKVDPPRPLTHDLLYNLVLKLGYKVKEVLIDRIEAQAYIATIYLVSQGPEEDASLSIDARPSDAIALALKADAPVMVSESLVAQSGLPLFSAPEKDEEFSSFVSGLKASDFKLEGNIPLLPNYEDPAAPADITVSETLCSSLEEDSSAKDLEADSKSSGGEPAGSENESSD